MILFTLSALLSFFFPCHFSPLPSFSCVSFTSALLLITSDKPFASYFVLAVDITVAELNTER